MRLTPLQLCELITWQILLLIVLFERTLWYLIGEARSLPSAGHLLLDGIKDTFLSYPLLCVKIENFIDFSTSVLI